MDPRMYPSGAQSIGAADLVTEVNTTNLVELFDATSTNQRKAASLDDIFEAMIDASAIPGITASAAEINKLAGVTGGQAIASKAVVVDAGAAIKGLCKPVVIATDTVVLTAADSGKIIVMNTTTTKVVTLPATGAGLEFTLFVLQAAGSAAGHSFSPNASDKIIGKGITAADDKDLINTQATAAIGDWIRLIGDGVDGWYIVGIAGTWAREA